MGVWVGVLGKGVKCCSLSGRPTSVGWMLWPEYK